MSLYQLSFKPSLSVLMVLCLSVLPAMAVDYYPSANQQHYQADQLGAFVHFGPATYTGNSDMMTVPSASVFNPVDLDASQWVAAAQSFDAEMVVLTAKHHNGFALWQTETTDYGVAQSPWKSGQGDVVEEFVDACLDADMGVGIYLSGCDMYRGIHSSPTPLGTRYVIAPSTQAYVDYTHEFIDQVTELCTRYGDVLEVMWLDGAHDPFGWDCTPLADPFVGTADEGRHPADVIADVIHELAPNAVIMGNSQPDLRWSGSEQGVAPYPLYNEVQQGQGSSLYLPSDFEGWCIPEANIHTRDTWFWTPNSDGQLRSTSYMMNAYQSSIGNGANLLVNMTPDTSGLIPAAEVQNLANFGDAIDAIYDQAHATMATNGTWTSANTLELDLGDLKNINKIILEENLADGQNVNAYVVEAYQNGQWNQVLSDQTIGRKRIVNPTPFTAEKLRVRFTNIDAPVSMSSVAAYGTLSAGDIGGSNVPTHFEDDFNDGVLDSSKWTPLEAATSSIVESDGVLRLTTIGADRAYLVSAYQWNAAEGDVTISGRFSLDDPTNSGSSFEVWLRASDEYDSAGKPNGTGTLSDGVLMTLWLGSLNYGVDLISATTKADTEWPPANIGGANFPADATGEPATGPGQIDWSSHSTFDFEVTDDGTNITFTITDVNDPSFTATCLAATTFDSGSYHIALGGVGNTIDFVSLDWDGVVIDEPIAGDANLDGKVDGSDVTILAGNWQADVSILNDLHRWQRGDFNLDGKVDGSDVTILAGNWQAGVVTQAASVPEPSMICLAFFLGCSVLLLRKKG